MNQELENHQEEHAAFNTTWLIGGLAALIPIGVALYFMFFWEPYRAQTEAPTEPIAVEVPMPESVEIPEPIATLSEPEPEIVAPPLPALNESDAVVTADTLALSSNPLFSSWLVKDELVRKFVVVVDNVAQGKVARKHIAVPKPKGAFKADESGVKKYLNPESYKRYDTYMDMLESIDAETAIILYHRYSPLFDKAYGELGYPNQRFNGTTIQAIDRMLATPVIQGDIELVRTSVLYQFADPDLEALPAIQKQLIRMGPRNLVRLQRKLREYRSLLVNGTP